MYMYIFTDVCIFSIFRICSIYRAYIYIHIYRVSIHRGARWGLDFVISIYLYIYICVAYAIYTIYV